MLKSLIVKTMPLPIMKPAFIGKEDDSKAGDKRKRMKGTVDKSSRCKLENDNIIVLDSEDDNDDSFIEDDNVDVQYFEALGERLELFERIDALDLPGNPLDVLINDLGPQNVAELTGRKLRANRKGEYESRTSDGESVNERNLVEKAAFMDGHKLVAIISEAASTGISLHAMNGARNQRKRLHVTVELAWSADRMVQQLGRTHRSNQSSSPAYVLIMSPLRGESRFGSAVCKRMQSMGALTQGDRGASSGSQTLDAFNFDTALGKRALDKLLGNLHSSNVIQKSSIQKGPTELLVLDASNDESLINEAAAIKRCDAASITFSIAAKLWLDSMDFNFEKPTVRGFFNRILGLETKKQNYLFSAFEKTFESEINEARKLGNLDQGISRVQGKILKFENPKIVLTLDKEHTKHVVVKADRGINFEDMLDIKVAAEEEFNQRQLDLREIELAQGYKYVRRPKDGQFGFYKITDSEKNDILCAADNLPVSYNKIGSYIQAWRPKTGRSAKYRYHFNKTYSKIEDLEEAKQLWIKEYSRPDREKGVDNRVVNTNLITGSILPVWSIIDKVISGSTKSKRYKIKIMKSKINADPQNGIQEQRLLGVFVDDRLLQKMLSELSNYCHPTAAIKRSVEDSNRMVRTELNDIEDIYNTTRMEVSDSGEKWICRICTYENHNSQSNCEVCNEEHLGEDHDNTWRCSFCSFSNACEDLQCSMCFNDKQSYDTSPKQEKSSNKSYDENTKLLNPNVMSEENDNENHTISNAAALNNTEYEKLFEMIMNPQNSCDFEKLRDYLSQEGINEADDLRSENITLAESDDPLKHVKFIADLLKSVKKNRFLNFYKQMMVQKGNE